jgi:hypothetical protein
MTISGVCGQLLKQLHKKPHLMRLIFLYQFRDEKDSLYLYKKERADQQEGKLRIDPNRGTMVEVLKHLSLLQMYYNCIDFVKETGGSKEVQRPASFDLASLPHSGRLLAL